MFGYSGFYIHNAETENTPGRGWDRTYASRTLVIYARPIDSSIPVHISTDIEGILTRRL